MSYFSFDTPGRVEFYDCDPMGMVWHGNYLKYLEMARSRFFDLAGYSYSEIHRDGFTFPVVDLKLRYSSSLRMGDEFTVTTDLEEYENRVVHSFVIRCSSRICLKARSVQVCLPNGSSGLSFTMPKNFTDRINLLLTGNTGK